LIRGFDGALGLVAGRVVVRVVVRVVTVVVLDLPPPSALVSTITSNTTKNAVRAPAATRRFMSPLMFADPAGRPPETGGSTGELETGHQRARPED
jgi:hypothetical protein